MNDKYKNIYKNNNFVSLYSYLKKYKLKTTYALVFDFKQINTKFLINKADEQIKIKSYIKGDKF